MKQPRRFGRTWRLACLVLALSAPIGAAAQDGGSGSIPSFRELEAAGALIGDIRINNRDIFDLDDRRENAWPYRLANTLHIRTRPGVVRRALLFKSGEPVSARLIEETERLLRDNDYLYDVRIEPIAYHDGRVDIEVTTRDTWTLDPGFRFSRQGGSNSSTIGLKEHNLLGTGITVGAGRVSDVDRTGNEYSIWQSRAFGDWVTIGYVHGSFDDGRSDFFTLARPFYALDTRWAAGVSGSTGRRIDSIYNDGTIVSQYQHASDRGEVFGGWSKGLVDGWTHRYSVGLKYEDDTYSTVPSLVAPSQLPENLRLVAPFFRYEVIQDDYEKLKNRNQIERVEYFALGFQSTLELGRATTALGSTRDLWLYDATVSDGFTLSPGDNVLVSAYANGRYGTAGGENQTLGAIGKYYNQLHGRYLFFASLSGDTLANGDAASQLQLGGDSGLRGYPLRYQTGTHRVVLSLEERVYSDWYPLRLFRIGAAAFVDVGRAWGGENQNVANPGWLSDVGIGLRILNSRSARGGMMHIDLAFPLNADSSIKSYQILFRTKSNF